MYAKLTQDNLLKWTQEDEQQLEALKTELVNAPVLSLPDLKKLFFLFVNIHEGMAFGVLAQEWAERKKPVGYLSKLLDPVSRGWPTCLQAVVAAALLVEEAHKVTFGGELKILSPHNIRGILQQKADKWITDARLLKYESILILSPELSLEVTTLQNPTQFLYGEPSENLTHDCLHNIEEQTKIRPDLEEEELEKGEKLFVDGSSRVVEGKRKSGYAIVDGKTFNVIESGPLSPSWSAQACELYAVLKALQKLKGKAGTIYTDSKYTYGVVHTFGKIWEERGLMNSQGNGLVHQELITQILQALRGPAEIAVVHLKGHQRGLSPLVRGNNIADQEAKMAALMVLSKAEEDPMERRKRCETCGSDLKEFPCYGCWKDWGFDTIECACDTPEKEFCYHHGEVCTCHIPKAKYCYLHGKIYPILSFSIQEKEKLIQMGVKESKTGQWELPDGREVLPKSLALKIMQKFHEKTHWGTQALVDQFTIKHMCIGVYNITKRIVSECITCQS